MRTVRIADKVIGDGQPPYFIAELGICHQGSVSIAKDNAKAAVEAGADCVKTELFYETEVLDSSARKSWSIRGKHYEVPLIEHMRQYQLSLDQHHEIKVFCDQLGVSFMATAHDRVRVDFLKDIGAAAIKIASPDIVHYPLIAYAATSGLALFLDTGGAYPHEVEMAVKTARDAGSNRIVVNHCPDGHPAPAGKHNLRAINHYKELLDLPVGISDHYDGYEMVYASAVAGANAIEKPVSTDRFIEECEHIWAISRQDLKEVIATMHKCYEALGDKRHPMQPGLRPYSLHRVALVAARDIEKGECLCPDVLGFAKPRLGIGVEHLETVTGIVLRRAKKQGEFITKDDV